MESLRWLIDLARRAGVRRIIINGSFVTDAFEPNDVDCALLIGADYPLDASAADELLVGLPFISMDLSEEIAFDVMVDSIFASDRRSVPKGMIEILP